MVLLKSGKVHFDFTTDGTHTFDIHYGREWIWYIPPELTRKELETFGRKVRKSMGRVCRGISIAYDESICEDRGTLTSDASAARNEIQLECERLFEKFSNHELGVELIDPFYYFENEVPDDYDLDADSSDDEIRRETDRLSKMFMKNNMMMNVKIFDSLKNWIKDYQSYQK